MTDNKLFTFWMSGFCIIVFILQNILLNFTETFMLTNQALSRPWQFLTAIFLHGDLVHLAYNLFALLLFGLILEKIIGSKKFLALFLFSGVIANLISFSFYPSSLGASGAIMAVIGMLAVLRPGMTVWAFNLPMPMFLAAILWIGGSLLGIFGFGEQNIGYIAHLTGLLLGLIFGFILKSGYAIKKVRVEEPLISEDYIKIWEDSHLR
jgi:membrane associated rhomboid family serine protease